MKRNFPKRKSPRLKDFDYSSPCAYFITICTKDKIGHFRKELYNERIVKCLIEERSRLGYSVYVYCLMPDHLHFLLSPNSSGKTVCEFVGALKSKTTKIAWDEGIEGKLWQERFYDHIVRKGEDLREIATYILNNPVRKGMVARWEDYPYCGLLDEII